jgi:tetratricopeptide (TPR) repeat protein
MKALAKEPAQRYASVAALRHDVELFQEGRSVSAKEDRVWEVLFKLVKRNKAISAALLVVMGVLIWSTWTNLVARRETEKAHQDFQQAQQEKELQIRQSLPAFVRAARLSANEKQFEDALKQLNIVLAQEPNQSDAHLLKAQFLIVQKDFAGARIELDQYLKTVPGDKQARQLAELCRKPQPSEPDILLAIADIFIQQQAHALAERLLDFAGGGAEAAKRVLLAYQKRIEAVWPGLGKRLVMDGAGNFSLYLKECGHLVKDLTPLQGMRLKRLELFYCADVRDLKPLKGMPLIWLDLHETRVEDLTPLRGLPLTTLGLSHTPVRDLSPLQGMKLRQLIFHHCGYIQDLTTLRGMPLTTLDFYDCPVQDLAPLEGMKLEHIGLTPRTIKKGMDILRQMKSLQTIRISNDQMFPAADFRKKYDAGEFK